ncbi:MAG: DUF58 domain-containing protein [Candidatus Wallbacteria bacterium]|nr:DUF58 domain-containing protein [Candidatus Wallbacteria bacterium]
MKRYLSPSVIAQIGRLDLVARMVVEGTLAGEHKSRFHGFNIEFAEHRQYFPGDELKHIDWKLYAKSDRYYVKQYEENTSLRAYILLDCSHSMAYPEEAGASALTKLMYARYLAAALAYLTLHQGDSVGIVTFSDHVRQTVAPRSHPSHLERILGAVDRNEAAERTDFFRIFQEFSGHIKRRALVIVLSDFFDEYDRIMQGVKFLKFLKHELILLHVLTPQEIDFPFEDYTNFIDMESGSNLWIDPRIIREKYKSAMQQYIHRLSQECRYRHIDYALFRTDQPFEVNLARFLAMRARRRI